MARKDMESIVDNTLDVLLACKDNEPCAAESIWDLCKSFYLMGHNDGMMDANSLVMDTLESDMYDTDELKVSALSLIFDKDMFKIIRETKAKESKKDLDTRVSMMLWAVVDKSLISGE